MREGIHPEYKTVTVICSCGNKFETRSTYKKDTMQVEICSACHPFFVGGQKIVDTVGRVQKFKDKFSRYKGGSKTTSSKTAKKDSAGAA